MILNMSKASKRLMIGSYFLLAGCAGSPPRLLDKAEQELGTAGPITMHYHSVLYYPDEIALHSAGYIVGIEKGHGSKILRSEQDIKFAQPGSTDKLVKSQQDAVHDGKIMFVSHIVRSQPVVDGKGSCALYDAYYRQGAEAPVVPDCNRKIEHAPEIAAEDAFSSGWQGMKKLQAALADDLESKAYTHVVVVVMGWNTVQEEAIRNINSIIRGIKNAKKEGEEKFNPIVVAVTWPSQWNSLWLDPLYKLTSFGTKSKDADEVGLTWLGVLLETTIPQASAQAKQKLPVVVIGHSFGARAASTAACNGPVIAETSGSSSSSQLADLLIAYQGAFLTDRLIEKRADGTMQNKCPRVGHIALTSSTHDSAVNRAFWGNYAGRDQSYAEYCTTPSEIINCVKAGSTGETTPDVTQGRPLTYVDADDLIKYNAFYTGGGAHSDIYRDEQGVLSWSLIKALGVTKYTSQSAMVQP